MIFTDTITIYNHYKDEQGRDSWKRTVIEGVMWKRAIERTVTADGRLETAEYISITIPAPKNYQKPIDWGKDRRGWTLNTKNGLDIVALGVQMRNISSDYRLKDFKRDTGDLGTVKAVHDNSNRDHLSHIKVIAI